MIDSSIISGISNIGFPIVAFILMYNMTTKTIKSQTDAINSLKISINDLKSIISLKK